MTTYEEDFVPPDFDDPANSSAWGRPDFADDDAGGEDDPQMLFASLPEFVEFLAKVYRRSLAGNDRAWCAEWWRHAEAIARLEALWRSLEHLRQDPALGASVWWRDHVDPHMSVLLSADGPFKHCTPEAHADRPAALPLVAPHPELFVVADPVLRAAGA